MCVISVISDYGRQMPVKNWGDLAKRHAFQQLLDKAKVFDKVAEQPDCHDAEKTAWLDEQKFYY